MGFWKRWGISNSKHEVIEMNQCITTMNDKAWARCEGLDCVIILEDVISKVFLKHGRSISSLLGKKSFVCLSGSGWHCKDIWPYTAFLFQCTMHTYVHSLLAINSPCQLVGTYPPTLPRNSGLNDHISELEERLWNGSRLATLFSLFSEKSGCLASFP